MNTQTASGEPRVQTTDPPSKTTHTVPDPANFALKEDDTIASKCKRVHAFGCRYLRDPESIRGDIRCSVDLLDSLNGYCAAETLAKPRATMVPCAIEKLKELATAGHYAE